MRVVVLGATGNVGSSLVRVLGEDPAVTEIIGVARRSPDWSPARTRWVRADIATDDLVGHLCGADAVVHLAWLIQPARDPLTTWRVNARGSARVFDAVARAGVPVLVYSSSVGAYSPGPKERRVGEDWPTDGWPTAAYCREKAYVERLLDAFERANPQCRVVRLRPGFVFQRESAAQQRRLFAGPFLPTRLLRPGAVPVVPDLPGFRLQVVHSRDVAEAFRLAVTGDARGAFNTAADPVLDAHQLAGLLDARVVPVPRWAARAAVATAWHLRLTPASPHLFDAALRLPLMDLTRARDDLGWTAAHSSLDAVGEFLDGLRHTAGLPTPPLAPQTGGRLREHELRTGVGSTG